KWGAGTHSRKWLPEDLIPEIENRILLFYSGTSRNSGINNWVLFKEFIDNTSDVRSRFQKIADSTRAVETALNTRDWRGAGEAIAQEWEIRKTLAKGITTPEIDRAFSESQEEGVLYGKICGAGGGGCFFTYFPTRSEEALEVQKAKVKRIFENHGMTHLSFKGARQGLQIQVNRA
ncbi:MAG: hypothetical protein HYX41_02720, partial [Bdellovibrio sp.]|nr:hypothetical protein [Bdellovibrio sp.]